MREFHPAVRWIWTVTCPLVWLVDLGPGMFETTDPDYPVFFLLYFFASCATVIAVPIPFWIIRSQRTFAVKAVLVSGAICFSFLLLSVPAFFWDHMGAATTLLEAWDDVAMLSGFLVLVATLTAFSRWWSGRTWSTTDGHRLPRTSTD